MKLINIYKMKYLYTKSEHYRLFLEKNNSNRLSKSLKITTIGDKSNLFKISLNYEINEEIFNSPLETDYNIIEINLRFKKVIFKSKSNTEYRIDIHSINEKKSLINHLSFSENDDKYDTIPNNKEDFVNFEADYDRLTNRNEMIEVLNRIYFIIHDLVGKDIISNYFCIGGTELEGKNNIYEYFLKVVVGESGFEKLKTDVYPKIGWGLYFKI